MKTKIKSFFYTIKESLYGPEFYSVKKSEPFRPAINYFLVFAVALTLLFTIFLGFIFAPAMFVMTNKDKMEALLSYYPAELEVKIEKGQASTNVAEPYAIPLRAGPVKNVIVIDTKKPFAPENFDSYETMILVTKDYIVSKENSGYKIEPIKSIPNVTLSRQILSNWVGKMMPYFKIFLPILFISIVAMTFLMYVGMYLSTNLVFAGIVYLVQKIRKEKILFKDMYKLGFYALTPMYLLSVFNLITPFSVPMIIAFIVSIVLVFINLKPKTATEVAPS